jgi:hypothetical protein
LYSNRNHGISGDTTEYSYCRGSTGLPSLNTTFSTDTAYYEADESVLRGVVDLLGPKMTLLPD